jgi:hypothetical protein
MDDEDLVGMQSQQRTSLFSLLAQAFWQRGLTLHAQQVCPAGPQDLDRKGFATTKSKKHAGFEDRNGGHIARGELVSAPNKQPKANNEPRSAMVELPTTVILRNAPKDCSLSMITSTLASQGFAKSYDFVHAPVDFATKESLGYVLVNMVDNNAAARLVEHFQGFRGWPSNHIKKGCSAGWSTSQQGLQSHVERYRNSPLMHKTVPQEYKPALYKDGTRTSFPPPTMCIKPPRVRVRHNQKAAVKAGSMNECPPGSP